MNGPWTAREDIALRTLFDVFGDDWPHYLYKVEQLADRTPTSCAGRLRTLGLVEYRTMPPRAASAVAPVPWPEPGVWIDGEFIGKRLFHDDPRADANRLVKRLGGPPVTTSYGTINYGCVAGWATA